MRTIKPVSKIFKIDTEIKRSKGDVAFEKREFFNWAEKWAPRVDIYEKENEIFVETELPGVSAKDISIVVQSSRMEIKGSKKERASSGEIHYLRLEREFGRFHRLVSLPCAVIPDKTKAYLENGILTIVMKKYSGKPGKDLVVKVE